MQIYSLFNYQSWDVKHLISHYKSIVSYMLVKHIGLQWYITHSIEFLTQWKAICLFCTETYIVCQICYDVINNVVEWLVIDGSQ